MEVSLSQPVEAEMHKRRRGHSLLFGYTTKKHTLEELKLDCNSFFIKLNQKVKTKVASQIKSVFEPV